MDRAGYFKKKGSTVDSKFARLHRRSIDQRAIRGKSFMDNRKLSETDTFSPVKEDVSKGSMMPPPMGAPPKASKKGALNRSVTKETPRATPATKAEPTPKKPSEIPTKPGGDRREKLMKWKAERDLVRKQEANKKKPQVFRVSASIDRKADSNLFTSSKTAYAPSKLPVKKPVPHPVSKVTPKPAPVPSRVTRSATRTQANNPKDTAITRSSTRSATRNVDPVPSKRAKQNQQPSSNSKPAPTRPVSTSRAPPTRSSARIAAAKPPAPTQRGKTTRSVSKGRKEKEEEKKEEVRQLEEEFMEQSSITVNEERGSNFSFVPDNYKGFSFKMDLPDVPFTPISPASASNFLFPSVSTLKFSPSQRRCSTPYSLRTRKSLARTPHQEEKVSEKHLEPTQLISELVKVAEDHMGSEVVESGEPKTIESQSAQVAVEVGENEPQEEEPITPPEISEPVTSEEAEKPTEVAMETEIVVEEQSKTKTESESDGATSQESIAFAPTSSEESEGEKPAVSPAAEKDVPYFKNLVSSETTRLLDRCDIWDNMMTDLQLTDEVVCGEIRSAIGKAKLLINQRFKQFNGLIKNCEFGLGEKVTNCSDLQGFWEMIYFQVEDVDALFKDLEKLKANNWQKETKQANKPKAVKKKKPVAKKPGTDAGAASRKAARERLMAARAAMKAKATRQAEADKVVFEGGFFKVESPARKNIREHCEAGSPFRSSRRNTPASRTATPKFVPTPKMTRTPLSSRIQPAVATEVTEQVSNTPKAEENSTGAPQQPIVKTPIAQLFSPMLEPRRSLRTRLCHDIDKLVLSDKKATPLRRTPMRGAKENGNGRSTPQGSGPAQQDTANKENNVDLSKYLMPCAPIDLNQQAEDLMVTEPQEQLTQLGQVSPKKSLRPRRSSVKPKDPFSPSTTLRTHMLNNSTNTSVVCSPVTRKTRKSSLGFGLSQAASLFTPTSTPEPRVDVPVADLISFD